MRKDKQVGESYLDSTPKRCKESQFVFILYELSNIHHGRLLDSRQSRKARLAEERAPNGLFIVLHPKKCLPIAREVNFGELCTISGSTKLAIVASLAESERKQDGISYFDLRHFRTD